MDDPHLDYVPKFTKHMHQWPEIADLPISKVSESKTKVSVLRNSLLQEGPRNGRISSIKATQPRYYVDKKVRVNVMKYCTSFYLLYSALCVASD